MTLLAKETICSLKRSTNIRAKLFVILSCVVFVNKTYLQVENKPKTLLAYKTHVNSAFS